MNYNKVLSNSLRVALFAGVLGLSGLTANACKILVTVACPNDTTAAGIQVCATSATEQACGLTDSLGVVELTLIASGDYTVCVTQSTLPPGATLSPLCKTVNVPAPDIPGVASFTLGGSFCSPPPVIGDCWLTGGGTIGNGKKPDYSYGGVVYPGCSPKAAEGGNWNVVAHNLGLHFQGQQIIVDSCSGVPTGSPKVTVNIIDFHGTGIVSGVGGNPAAKVPVTFVARAVDIQEPGHDNDMLFVSVFDGSGVVLQIGNSATDPAVVSTGNLQIHQSSCGK